MLSKCWVSFMVSLLNVSSRPCDWFWGFGEDAAREAGRMKQEGRMWLLWPRGERLPANAQLPATP